MRTGRPRGRPRKIVTEDVTSALLSPVSSQGKVPRGYSSFSKKLDKLLERWGPFLNDLMYAYQKTNGRDGLVDALKNDEKLRQIIFKEMANTVRKILDLKLGEMKIMEDSNSNTSGVSGGQRNFFVIYGLHDKDTRVNKILTETEKEAIEAQFKIVGLNE